MPTRDRCYSLPRLTLWDRLSLLVSLACTTVARSPPPASLRCFTAVGIPGSLLRFAALHSYDNVREPRLPLELRDRNPTGHMWRCIDGTWARGDVPVTGA